MNRQSVIRLVALASTAVLAWTVLTLGFADEAAGGPAVGEVASREYRARVQRDVVDAAATAAAAEAAAAEIEPRLVKDPDRENVVYDKVNSIIAAVRAETQPNDVSVRPVPPTTSTSSTTTTTVGSEETTTTVPAEEPQLGTIEGLVFLDVNGDGLFDTESVPTGGWSEDRAWAQVDVVAIATDGTQYRATTDRDGSYSIEVPQGDYEVLLDSESAGYPAGFGESTDNRFAQEVACSDTTCEAEPVGLTAQFGTVDDMIATLTPESALLSEDTWATLIDYGMRDVYRELLGRSSILEQINTHATNRLTTSFRIGISPEDLDQAQTSARTDRTSVDIDGVRDDLAREVVNSLVGVTINSNLVEDQDATEELRLEAAQAVDEVVRTFVPDQLIIGPGATFTQFEIDAINQTGANTERRVRQAAMFGVLVVLVAVLGFYLARFRKVYWDRPRMVTLFGMLIVLAAGAVRLTVQYQDASSWYVLPAVAFGYLSAVLFDNRMGTLMAMAVGVLALLGSGEPGLGVYATLATLAPIGFVSSVSTRRSFRNSVLVSAVSAAVIAAASSWLFEAEVGESPLTVVWQDAAWAGAVALMASLVALAAMPFFEGMFDITTTLRLLELTDRNHEALQVLQEKAFGTFNHSLMVGTLADSAARSVGANNLLARAAAYYHDLGKTENPLYFIENQFGVANPHDEMAPEESAQVIRQHVLDGIELAKKFNIPSEVAEGIRSHHGDGIMRFFYEKARQSQGADTVNPDDFRHAGHKPGSREMAILMMADAVEGACRAVFADEEPTHESIAKVVNRVIDEKVGDGQLSECDLTFGELTKVRKAFIDALTGHYHQRIPYPNFPGS